MGPAPSLTPEPSAEPGGSPGAAQVCLFGPVAQVCTCSAAPPSQLPLLLLAVPSRPRWLHEPPRTRKWTGYEGEHLWQLVDLGKQPGTGQKGPCLGMGSSARDYGWVQGFTPQT